MVENTKNEETRKAKRGAQGNGSMRQRKDGTWEARYTVGRDPGTGKQIQKSVYGKTQAEVRKKLRQLTTDIDNGVYIEPIQNHFRPVAGCMVERLYPKFKAAYAKILHYAYNKAYQACYRRGTVAGAEYTHDTILL